MLFVCLQAYGPRAVSIRHYSDGQLWFLFSKCAFVN